MRNSKKLPFNYSSDTPVKAYTVCKLLRGGAVLYIKYMLQFYEYVDSNPPTTADVRSQ